MRKFLGLISILGFAIVTLVFTVMDTPFQIAFIASVFVFTQFIVSFYGLTIFEEKEVKLSRRFPSLSVVIPAYNSEKTIQKCLEHVLAMEYPRKYEVIVVDDGSTDGTIDIVRKYPVRIIHRTKNKGKAASLNEAIRQVKSELVACIDSDTYPPKDLLLKSVPYMGQKDLGAMTFFITAHNPKTIWQKMQEIEYFFSFGAFPFLASKFNSILVTPGPLTIFKRKALVKVGGFAEDNITEDFEMGLKLHKAGFRIDNLPISVPTEVPATFSGLMRQRVRWYRGTIYNVLLYKDFMFNRKYADVGTFAFPIIVMYIPVTVTSFFFAVARTGHYIYDTLVQAGQVFAYGQAQGIVGDPLFIGADMLILSSFLVSYLFFLWMSLSLINERFTLKRIVGFLMVVFVYPFVNAGFYALSVYKEAAGSDFQW
jgi:cellulose synthase/poly-beta-1,6-N-acetylglucosamine synthase-like glycosyltransferase